MNRDINWTGITLFSKLEDVNTVALTEITLSCVIFFPCYSNIIIKMKAVVHHRGQFRANGGDYVEK